MHSVISWLRRWLDDVDAETWRNQGQIVADPWKTMPKDIMETVARRLHSTDYIRSSAVCKPWRSLLLQSDILRPQSPWLLLPHHPGSRTLKFFNLLEGEFHTFVLPEPVNGGRVVGTSRGWLVMVKDSKPMCKISLFNPISGAKCQLPPLPTTPSLRRVELSSSDISDCTVAAIFDDFAELALCKPGDERWEVLLSSSEIEKDSSLIDIMFCSQKLHVLISSETDNGGKIEDLVVKQPNSAEAVSITLIHDLHDRRGTLTEVEGVLPFLGYRIFVKQCHISYLVESTKGRVLLIQKLHSSFYVPENEVAELNDYLNVHEDSDQDDDNTNIGGDEAEENNRTDDAEEEEDDDEDDMIFKYTGVDSFNVHDIEDLAGVKRLCIRESLGEEQAVFLSSNCRLCLPAAAAATGSDSLQGNSVHFIMDYANPAANVEPYLVGANGVYHPGDLRIEPLLPEIEFPWSTEFMWFAPNLQQ